MAITGKPGIEVGEPPGGGEEGVVFMATSGESGPEAQGERTQGRW
jgi:hypothetical protein